MKWKHIASIGLLCLLGACAKEEDRGLEPFTLAGTVTEHGGSALSGVVVTVTASDYSPLNGNNNRYPAGETTTDASGHFAVIPYKYNGITNYELKLSKDGFYDKIVTIPADLARKAPQNTYSSDIDMNRR